MKDIQFLNIIWVLFSFLMLYYGLTGDGQDLYDSFIIIILMFLFLWFIGIREKKKEFDKYIETVGDEVKGQWG